jgi:hypothetical protein
MKRLFVAPSGFKGSEQEPRWMRYTKHGHMRRNAADRDPASLLMLRGSNKMSTAGNRLYPEAVQKTDPAAAAKVNIN